MPYNPCEFNTINVSWIWNQIDGIELYLSFIDDEEWDAVPCYILIQEPLKSILSTLDTDKSYLVDYNYWFGDSINFDENNGKCDIYNLTNALYCNNDTNITYAASTQTCRYPLVESKKYKMQFLEEWGLEHCGYRCDFNLYKGDMDALVKF